MGLYFARNNKSSGKVSIKIMWDEAIPGVTYFNKGIAKSIRNFKSRYFVVKEETNKPNPIAIVIIITNKTGKYTISHCILKVVVWK